MVVTSLLLNAQERTKTEDLEKRVQVLEKALNGTEERETQKSPQWRE